MKDRSRQNGRGTPKEDFSEFGEVRVISRPAPDAEDRLRRVFTLLLRYATQDGKAEEPGGDRRPAERDPNDPANREI